MLNIEKYKDEIIEEYQNLMKTTAIDGDGNRMNKAIRTIAYKHCRQILLGEYNPFKWKSEEYKEQILDDVEREYLSAVIKPFRKKISCIRKSKDPRKGKKYIKIVLCDGDTMYFPYLENDAMYKGMKLDRNYTLEELRLWNQLSIRGCSMLWIF